MQSIRKLVEESAEKFGNKTFLYFKNQKISFMEVNRISNLVASAFQDKGIRKGDRVALMLTNRPEFIYLWFGLNKIGASVVPIDTELAAYEVEYILKHSEAKMVATEERTLARIQDAPKIAPGIDKVVLLDGVGENKKWVSFTSFIAGQQDSFESVDIDNSTEAAILYTRKTGALKGCIVDQFYYLNMGELYLRENMIEVGDRIMIPLPLSHMGAQGIPITGALFIGASILLLDRFQPDTWWKTIREKGVTNFHYLGFIPAMLMRCPETPYDYGPEKAYGIGTGCPKDIQAAFEKRFNIELLEGYGATELGSMCFMMGRKRHKDRKIGTGTFGTPVPDCEAKIVDDNDQEVPRRAVGELVVRSSDPLNRKKGMMKEYYKDPEATKQAWRNEWFHTGDLCFVDEDNYFYFVDRKKI